MPRPDTVLIVDDYPDSLDVWSLYLRAAGFTVLTAADGQTALDRARRHLPDLIVLDLELPGLDGWKVAQALRAEDTTRQIPLIAATGCSVQEKVEYAWTVGFNLVLAKPCDPDRLVAAVRRLLADRGSRPSEPHMTAPARRRSF